MGDSSSDESEIRKESYLEEDEEIPGQKWAVLSLILPHSMVQKRELFYMEEFFLKNCERLKLNKARALKFLKEFESFKDVNGKALDQKFAEANDNQTSITGLKIRGVYGSEGQADERAKYLQRTDSDFNVFKASVGKWLPISPSIEYHIENEVYLEDQLQNLMSEYKKNQQIKDDFFEQEKREKMKDARSTAKKNNAKNAKGKTKADDLSGYPHITVGALDDELQNYDHQANKEASLRALNPSTSNEN